MNMILNWFEFNYMHVVSLTSFMSLKVAVLSMGSDVLVSQPGSCYDDSLAPASAEVKEHLISFINGIKAIDGK